MRADALARVLQPAGLVVIPVSDGERALTKARAAKPDLFVVGSALPDMSGFSLCNRLRRAPGLSDVPIVIVSGKADASAMEAHRGSKTPATDYLPPDAPPEQLLARIQAILGVADADGVEELSTDDIVDLPDVPGDEPLFAKPAAKPPPLTSGPARRPATNPPVPAPAQQLRAISQRARVADPFAEMPAEPRLTMGASPEEKAAYFRDRLKAKDELLAKVKGAWGQLQESAEAAERELAGMHQGLGQALEAKKTVDAALATSLADAQQARAELGGALAARKDADERAQSISTMLSETLSEREQSEKDWAAKTAEAAQRLQLLQEETEHLATELESVQKRAEETGGTASTLKEQLEAAEKRAAELQEALTGAKIEAAASQGEAEAAQQELDMERARAASASADIDSERQSVAEHLTRITELENELVTAKGSAEELERDLEAAKAGAEELERDLEAARQGGTQLTETLHTTQAEAAQLRAELEAERERHTRGGEALASLEIERSLLQQRLDGAEVVYATTVRELEVARGAQKALEEELQGALVSRGELEQRTGESAGEVAELRGQVEALQQADREWQDRMSGLENQLVRFEAALSSREEESAGLRAELKQALAEREQLQDEMAGQISQLAQQLREKDKQILQATQAQAHAQAQAQLANQAAQAAQAAAHVAQTAQAAARPPSSPGNPAAEKEAASLRVRLSDISAELKALRAKSAKAASGGGASADEVAKLRDELEAQRAENDFLNNEIERLRAGRSGAQAVEGDETAVLDLPNLK